jgi:ABC-type glycerol-3-phosphate transport system substrate-binding protein
VGSVPRVLPRLLLAKRPRDLGRFVAELNPRLRAAIASMVLAAVVVACAVAPAGGSPPITLVIWVDNPAIGASIRQRIVPFMHDYPNITVKVFDQFGRIRNGDVSTAIEALANSELSPDVVALTNQDFGLMSNRGDLTDLRPYIYQETNFNEDDFFPTTMEAFQDRGKQLAIPSELVPWVVFYNQTLFDQAKVTPPSLDWTTSEFISDAARVQALDRQKQQIAGFVADPTLALLPFVEEFGVVPQNGADDPDARWLDDKRTADALQWFVDLNLRQRIMPTEPGNRSLGLWFVGRAAMTATFMDQRNQLPPYLQRRLGVPLTPTATASPTPPPGWRFKWGVTMMPKAETQTTVYYLSGYGIPQTSRNPEEAWMLIDYLTRHLPDQPGRAYVPSRESLAQSKTFAELYPETGREAYIRSIEIGHPIPVWPPAAQPTYQDLEGALTGAVHPENALHAFRDRVQPILSAPPPPTPTPLGG